MRKRMTALLLIAAAAAAGILLPFQSSDVAELVPVEALVISVENGTVVLDGGDCRGMGKAWPEAVQDLKKSGNGRVFLAAAEQIVLCAGAEALLEEVVGSDVLRPAAGVCLCPGKPPSAADAAAFLAVRRELPTLQQLRAKLLRQEQVELPVLTETKGGLRLYGP